MNGIESSQVDNLMGVNYPVVVPQSFVPYPNNYGEIERQYPLIIAQNHGGIAIYQPWPEISPIFLYGN